VLLAELDSGHLWVGEKVAALEEHADCRVAFLSRMGEALVPERNTVIQDGDIVHIIARADEVERINAAVAARNEEGA
jgi:trk system potassium uptake protein TrkA